MSIEGERKISTRLLIFIIPMTIRCDRERIGIGDTHMCAATELLPHQRGVAPGHAFFFFKKKINIYYLYELPALH